MPLELNADKTVIRLGHGDVAMMRTRRVGDDRWTGIGFCVTVPGEVGRSVSNADDQSPVLAEIIFDDIRAVDAVIRALTNFKEGRPTDAA